MTVRVIVRKPPDSEVWYVHPLPGQGMPPHLAVAASTDRDRCRRMAEWLGYVVVEEEAE